MLGEIELFFTEENSLIFTCHENTYNTNKVHVKVNSREIEYVLISTPISHRDNKLDILAFLNCVHQEWSSLPFLKIVQLTREREKRESTIKHSMEKLSSWKYFNYTKSLWLIPYSLFMC